MHVFVRGHATDRGLVHIHVKGDIFQNQGLQEIYSLVKKLPLEFQLIRDIRAALPRDTIFSLEPTMGAYSAWQMLDIYEPRSYLYPMLGATLGYSLPAALGAKVGAPDKTVLALVGDGAFSSNMSVVATAVEANISVTWLVMDNLAHGTIALLKEHHYDSDFGCVFTCNGQPYSVDYATVAQACGAQGITIEQADQLAPALEKAFLHRTLGGE